jgi:hypothetical protein
MTLQLSIHGSQDRSFDGTGASTIDVTEFGSDITQTLNFI